MKDWKHYIIDSSGNYLYWNGAAVSTSATPIELPEGPEGWDGIAIAWQRDMTKIGVVRSYTVPLTFIKDGYQIITSKFYAGNIETKLSLRIQKRKTAYTGTYLRHNYLDFYTGEIDLTSFKDNGNAVTVTVSEGGLSKKIKAAENTVQELSMESNYINVLLDGYNIDYGAKMMATEQKYQPFLAHDKYLLSFYNISEEQQRLYMALFNVEYTPLINTYDFLTSDKYFLTVTDPITFDFHFRLKGLILKSTTATGNVWARLYNQNGTIVSTLMFIAVGTGVGGFPVDIDVTVSITLAANERLFLVGGGTPAPILSVYESTTEISYQAKFRETIIKAKLPSQVFRELVGAAAGMELFADTTFIEQNDAYALTPGDSVRGLDNVVMKTTLNNFNDFARVVFNGGFGIVNDKAVIKDYGDFLSTASPIQIKVKNLVISDATDLRCNTIKIGYPDQQIDDVNGRYEFNNTHVYDTPVKSVQKELTLVSPYLAQPFLIEARRQDLDGKTTTDNGSDNDIFIIHIDLANPLNIDGVTVYKPKRQVFDSVEGIPDSNIYNLLISPKRLLRNVHYKYINSLMDGFEGQELIFKSTEKNHGLKTELAGDVVDEDANETIGPDKYFILKYLDADTEVPVDLVTQLDPDPNVCFAFGQGGEGFIIKAGIQPETKQEQSYKLLATPNVDISNLQTNAYK